jgi:hypothetical protein
MDQNKYQAGVCNIGAAEREKRKWAGIQGVLIALGITFLGYVWAIPDIVKLIVFFPAFIGAVGLLQYFFKFCAYFGLNSVYNFNEIGKRESVADANARELDRISALKLLAYAFLAAAVYTLLTILLF